MKNLLVKKYQVLSRDSIKYFSMITMFLSHFATIFLKPTTLIFEIFFSLGFFSAITMCVFLVEGYRYTHSKEKYFCRLLIFALISEVPWRLAFNPPPIMLNMLFTLIICFLILIIINEVTNKILKTFIILGLVLLSSIGDWGILAAIFTIVFAKWNTSKKKMFCAYSICLCFFSGLNYLNLMKSNSIHRSLLFAFIHSMGILMSGIAIVLLYSGKKSQHSSSFAKWGMYIFYPLHLLILAVLRIYLQ